MLEGVTTRAEMLVRYKLMVSEMGIILLGTPEDVDIVYSAWRHAAVHIK